MRQTLQSQDLWQGEFYNRHKEGWACVMFVSVVQAWQRNQALYRLVVLQIGCAAF